MVSDMIVVWRAWTLCNENRKMMAGPLLALLGSIGKSSDWIVFKSVSSVYYSSNHYRGHGSGA